MKNWIFSAALILFLSSLCMPDFLSEQKKNERVRKAYEEKEKEIVKQLKTLDLHPDNIHMLIAAFKAEKELIIYVKSKKETAYKKLITYAVCASSGKLGPKRKEGDKQVPEGFYHITQFNPLSKYHLSLGINYPNQSDRLKSDAANSGGDIFIHGSCKTIGCLPMTDDKIKEIYLYAVQARQNGQKNIPVYIFPFKLTDEKMAVYQEQFAGNQELIAFWKNLKTGYDKFQSMLKELSVTVDKKGNYLY